MDMNPRKYWSKGEKIHCNIRHLPLGMGTNVTFLIGDFRDCLPHARYSMWPRSKLAFVVEENKLSVLVLFIDIDTHRTIPAYRIGAGARYTRLQDHILMKLAKI